MAELEQDNSTHLTDKQALIILVALFALMIVFFMLTPIAFSNKCHSGDTQKSCKEMLQTNKYIPSRS